MNTDPEKFLLLHAQKIYSSLFYLKSEWQIGIFQSNAKKKFGYKNENFAILIWNQPQ